MHWRIWFDIYVGDRKIGSGVWHQPYTYKCNAVRAAKKKFGYERVNRRAGKTYIYKWVVSQTNPRQ